MPALKERESSPINPIVMQLFNPKTAIAICLLIYAMTIVRTFLFEPFPGGVDVATHLFQIGFISNEGSLSPDNWTWNHWWYNGHPLLDQYPPLSHFLGALIVPLFGIVGAYKIIASLVFLFIPISFYLLLQEFELKSEQRAFALYLFAFAPVFTYYLQGGVFSALCGLPFALLFLKYLIRAINAANGMQAMRSIVLSGMFFALSALSHLLIPVAAALFGFVYLVSFKPDIPAFKRLCAIGMLAAALAGFFWVPMALNYKIEGPALDLAAFPITQLVLFAFNPFGRAFAVYINYVSILSLAVLGVLTVQALHSDYKNKTFKYAAFFLVSAFAVIIWILFLPHSGQAGGKLPFFLPMIFALLLCRYFDPSKMKIRLTTYLSIALLVLLLVSVFVVKNSGVTQHTYELAEWAADNTENKALFLPKGYGLLDPFDSKANADSYLYETFLFPQYFHKEVFNGWFGETEPREEISQIMNTGCGHSMTMEEIKSEIGLFSRIIYAELDKNCVINISTSDFCEVVQNSAVDAVFINTNFNAVGDFADRASCLQKRDSNGPLVFYKVLSPKPYADRALDYTKKSGTITITLVGPIKDNIVTRESYYPPPLWNAQLDGTTVSIEKTQDGFISVPVDIGAGKHELKLVFLRNNFGGVFDIISFFALVLIAVFLLKPEILNNYQSKIEQLIS